MKRITALVIVILILAFAMVGCSSASDAEQTTAPEEAVANETEVEAEAEEETPYVIFVNCGAVYPYPAATAAVFEELCEARGWKYDVLDSQADATIGAKNMQQAITMKPDVIVTMYVDSIVEGEATKLACEAGIPVVLDTGRPDPAYEEYVTCYNGVNDIMAGEVAAEMMNEALGGKGKVVIIEGIPGQQTTEDRNEGFRNKLTELNSNIEILAYNAGEWSKEKAVQVMEDFLTRYGTEIDGVFAHCDEQASGAALAIEEAGYGSDEFVIIGVGGSKTGLQNVQAGKIYGTTYQSPRTTMMLSIEAIEYIIENDLEAGVHMEPFWRWIELPGVNQGNVEEFLPGEW